MFVYLDNGESERLCPEEAPTRGVQGEMNFLT